LLRAYLLPLIAQKEPENIILATVNKCDVVEQAPGAR
jgi:hypothetical protein